MSLPVIRHAEDEIFRLWKQEPGHTRFVPDGVVDESKFGSLRDARLVYLLKEPFDDPKQSSWNPWDLRDYLKQGAYNKWRWRVPARWACHICGGDQRWNAETNTHSSEFRKKWLAYLAVVNIKKTGGESRCNVADLYAYALEKGYGKKYLLPQIALYSPTAVICGGPHVYNIARSIHNLQPRDETHFYSFAWNCQVISFYHYAASKSHSELHFPLVETVRGLLSID